MTTMTRAIILISVLLVTVGCEKEQPSKPVPEMSSKKSAPKPRNKTNTGVYNGQVIKKMQSADPYFRLGMGDFKLMVPNSVAKDRKILEYFDKWISVKGHIEGDVFTVSEWLD